MQGQNLLTGKARRSVHSEFANIKMIRTAEWKLVHYLHAKYGELYNLQEDPHELYNRYEDPGAAKARHEMEHELADWLIDVAEHGAHLAQVTSVPGTLSAPFTGSGMMLLILYGSTRSGSLKPDTPEGAPLPEERSASSFGISRRFGSGASV